MGLRITIESTFHVLSGYYKPGNMDFTNMSTEIHGAAIQGDPHCPEGKTEAQR